MRYFYTSILFLLVCNCLNNNKTFTKQQVVGAWTIYALNFAISDTISMGNSSTQNVSVKLLETELRPFRSDTLPNGNIQISYFAWLNNKPLPNNVLPYHTVVFDSTKIVEVHFEDYGIGYIDDEREINDKQLLDYLANQEHEKLNMPLILKQAYFLRLQEIK